MMIEKNIFFIWIGSKKPDYLDYVMKSFKEINPTFNINLIYETNFDNPSNEDVKEFKENIYNKLCENTYNSMDIYYLMYNRKFSQTKLKNKNIVRFCDCFRFYIINKYGGIYLDCDTFPVKPFDDKILNKNSLFLNYWDLYFFAYKKNYLIDNVITKKHFGPKDNIYEPEGAIRKYIKNNIIFCMPHEKYYKTIRDEFYYKFINLELKYGDKRFQHNNNYYFDHYRVQSYE